MLCSISPKTADKVFAIQMDRPIFHAFVKACSHADIIDLHFHDL